MNRIRKGDKVRVRSGKNRGKDGTVVSVDHWSMTAVVEGVNKVKIHKKAGQGKDKGEIVQQEAPINLSKLALLDPKNKGMMTRINYVLNKDNKKVRRSKLTKTDFGGK